MALFECKLFSNELFRSVNVNVTLPLPDSNNQFFESSPKYPENGQKFQVLWLLHGFSADESDWQRFSCIERYAQLKNVAVVMPDGYNNMYSNSKFGARYFNYYTQELPKMLRSIFPLSDKREDNFIAGLSMGGYGAYKAAFTYPENYCAAASLSGGVDVNVMLGKGLHLSGIPSVDWAQNVFGEDFRDFDADRDDLTRLLKADLDAGKELPRLYMCIGTEDFLYDSNQMFRNYMTGLNVDFTYDEGPGVHNFDFWDPQIRKILDWLPLNEGFSTAG